MNINFHIPKDIPIIKFSEPDLLLEQVVVKAQDMGYDVSSDGFKYKICLEEKFYNDKKDEIHSWLSENSSKPCVSVFDFGHYQYIFYFTDEIDAMSFKLSWI